MHIKRFTGPTVKDAMRDIKAEFGESALILSTKKLSQGVYEVVAAADQDLNEGGNSNAQGTFGAALAGQGAATGHAAYARAAVRQAAPANAEAGGTQELINEIKELKEFCWAMMTQNKTRITDIYAGLEEEFVKNGIDKRLAQKILMNTLKGVSGEKASDVGYLRSCMKNRIFEKISVTDPLEQSGAVTFVGPAGVGKTTTIAKLAAIQALKKKKKIALLTMDTYRIAAAEQLKVYGRIIGVPVDVARDSREVASLIEAHSDKELILIDTAGRSQKNQKQIDELKDLSETCPSMRFNLVLSTQTRDEALYDCVRGFNSQLPVGSLTFTKLDECGVYGPILNTMILASKPAAYLTAGQRVPEDIEVATKERLVNFFMPN